jgi:hypothetical protein
MSFWIERMWIVQIKLRKCSECIFFSFMAENEAFASFYLPYLKG